MLSRVIKKKIKFPIINKLQKYYQNVCTNCKELGKSADIFSTLKVTIYNMQR